MNVVPRFLLLVCKIAGGVLALVLIAGGLLLGLAIYWNAPPDRAPAGVYDEFTLEVRPGESAISVGQRMEEAGIIKSAFFWNILSRLDKRYIKAGAYAIPFPASQMEIRSALVTGREVLFKITIPEGVTLKKTARILEDADICNAADFLSAAEDPGIRDTYRVPGATMEGYLYPDTYFFPQGYPAAQVVKTMADTFFSRLGEIAPEALEMDSRRLNERVILASIVEREYRVPEEAALMAGVFYNRLSMSMPLQSCATVEYVITEIQGKPHPERIFDRDTEIANPYNTYTRAALPPGPISAPGKTALDAAFHPEKSDYLYFRVSDPAEGRHYFSRTLDDHIRAGALYVKRSL